VQIVQMFFWEKEEAKMAIFGGKKSDVHIFRQ
jgi:hypothetical protein